VATQTMLGGSFTLPNTSMSLNRMGWCDATRRSTSVGTTARR
jgi:hypothetical protein